MEKWNWGSWGSLHAKDGIQSVGQVLVPVAKLSLSQFQDHVRVTLEARQEMVSVQIGHGGWEWGGNEPLQHR